VTGTDPVDGAALSDKLLGIVSWGLGNGDAGCGDPTLPGVYTRVSDPKINAFLSQ
jgi:secreted trypsin-like serine protease